MALAGGSLYSPFGVWAVRCVARPGAGGGGGAEDGDEEGGIGSCIGARRVSWEPGRVLHSSTSHLNLRCFFHGQNDATQRNPRKVCNVEPESGRV